jgi:hypothetical protein
MGDMTFNPPSDGYSRLNEAQKGIGITSKFVTWNVKGVDPAAGSVTLHALGVSTYASGSQVEQDGLYTCHPVGSQAIACTADVVVNVNHEPWYQKQTHFHMQRTSSF